MTFTHYVVPALVLAGCREPSESAPSSSDPDTCATTKDCAEGKTCYGRKCVARENLPAPAPAGASPGKAPSGATPSSSSAAGRAPSFDSEAYCESVSQAGGGSYVIKKACLEGEAEAKRWIREQHVADRIYEHCTSVGEVIGGAFSIMGQCIRDENEAANALAGPDGGPATLGPEKAPSFDTEAYCETISLAIGGSFAIKRQCEQDEERAKLELSRTKFPPRVYTYCQRMGKTIGGSYDIMLTCARDEVGAMQK